MYVVICCVQLGMIKNASQEVTSMKNNSDSRDVFYVLLHSDLWYIVFDKGL